MTSAITLQNLNLGIEITEKKKTFTSFLLVPILIAASFTAACSWSNVLADGVKILGYIPLAVNIALPLVCIDAAICLAATAAAGLVNAAQGPVLQLFQQWQAAAAAAQPGILLQLQAAIQVLNQKYEGLLTAFKVSDPAISGEVGAILSACLSSIQQIAQLTSTVLAAGGTKEAAIKAVKASSPKITPKQFKVAVSNALKVKSNNPMISTLNTNLLTQVKAW
jgi:hypothetical protein